ncbi:MAG: RNA polymerase sigma factor [Bacteroidia bacterium]
MENPPLKLLIQCKGNDRKAHFELYKWCFEDMVKICRRYLKQEDELKAAVNMSFLKLIQSMDKAIEKHEELVFFHWMRRITLNHVIDEFRKNKGYKHHVDLVEDEAIINTHSEPSHDEFSGKAEMANIQHAIDHLPPMSKAVFNLYAVEGYKHEEIAELLNISANTSKVHFMRARLKLQELLGREKSLTS